MTSRSTSAHTRTTRAISMLILLMLLIMSASAALAEPTLSIGFVEITNVREASFNISWVTDGPATGIARCYDTSGALVQTGTDSTNATTHYALMTGLSPSTTYQCEVESGGVVNNNNGGYYVVTTGSTPQIPPPGGTVYGPVFLYDGTTPANGAIVYARIIDANGQGTPGRSQWASARVAQGFWFIDLNSIRTTDANAYFSYTPGQDQLEYWAQGGVYGTWGLPVLPETVATIPLTLPGEMPTAVLNNEPALAVTFVSFSAVSQAGGVMVAWETASEIDNQGFNLYRASDSAGPQTLLTFVPSQAPGSTQGFAYQWLDEDVVSGETYYYWLEDVDLAGATTLHGPVSTTFQTPTAVEVASFAAQPASAAPLLPWLLALPALLGGAAYALCRAAPNGRRPRHRCPH